MAKAVRALHMSFATLPILLLHLEIVPGRKAPHHRVHVPPWTKHTLRNNVLKPQYVTKQRDQGQGHQRGQHQ